MMLSIAAVHAGFRGLAALVFAAGLRDQRGGVLLVVGVLAGRMPLLRAIAIPRWEAA